MKAQLMYIERKDGLAGPARIGWVARSKTGRTLYYAGRSFQSLKGSGYKANYFDTETGQWYWISRPRKDGMDALYSALVVIDPDARDEYWVNVRGLPSSAREGGFDSPGKHSRRKAFPELAVHGSVRNGVAGVANGGAEGGETHPNAVAGSEGKGGGSSAAAEMRSSNILYTSYSAVDDGRFDSAKRRRPVKSCGPPTVGEGTPSQAFSTDSKQAEYLLSELQGRIEPVRRNAAYRLAILLVATVMLLLPVIYIGLIGLVCWGVYYHVVHHFEPLGSVRGHFSHLAFTAYLLPMIAGPILIVFMIKPLFARPQRRQRPQSLNRDSDPLLFAFVDRVCAAVGAPAPKRIDVDCQVNASAGLRHGIWSVLWRGDLVLTIGLPMVAGLDTRQFAGVLAHEFGHFSQGAGMRLSYLVRSVSRWFHRVVYERDRYDAWLAARAERHHVILLAVASVWAAHLFIWAAQKILWLLMMFGHGVASVLLRQMEFDADRHGARLVGGDSVELILQSLQEMNVAMEWAKVDVAYFYRNGKLPDDLPGLMMARLRSMPENARREIRRSMIEREVHWWDTHPPAGERIANAMREASHGIFRAEMPARVLFSDFAAQCRANTLEHYRELLGPQFDPRLIRPLPELLWKNE